MFVRVMAVLVLSLDAVSPECFISNQLVRWESVGWQSCSQGYGSTACLCLDDLLLGGP